MNIEEFQKEMEHMRKMALKYISRSSYILNPDEETINTIFEGLAKNKIKYGFAYCPCRLVSGNKEEDRKNICPCIYHKDEIAADGHCHCYLFVSPNYQEKK